MRIQVVDNRVLIDAGASAGANVLKSDFDVLETRQAIPVPRDFDGGWEGGHNGVPR